MANDFLFHNNQTPCPASSATVTENHCLHKYFLSCIIAINLIGLILLSVWFRCHSLENIPGLNGDEAWYGVQAIELLRETPTTWHTPTGNPLNPMFIGPMMLLHLCFEPSFVLLRVVALGSGLLALLINWALCRWIFNSQMAWFSTVVLAILPINIAYSRYAWDASQSLAVTLPVLYFAVAAIRFPQWNVRLIIAAALCQIAAVLVHPTNIFAAAAIAVAIGMQFNLSESASTIRRWMKNPLVILAALALCFLMCVWIKLLGGTPMLRWLGMRYKDFTQSNDILNLLILYPRLFTGGTIYRYLAGSHSWFQGPWEANPEGIGPDIMVFWLAIIASAIILWRSWKTDGRREDGVLFITWALQLAAFFLVAGPSAMKPGVERFSICLIAPTIILLCRAFILTWSRSSSKIQMAIFATAALLGWFVLADFHTNYFRFIQSTGGQAHLSFRTAAEEPKAAALKYIVKNRRAGKTLVVASDWWNYWPLKYLSINETNISVLTSEDAAKNTEKLAAAIKEGQIWYVEFSESKQLKKIEAEFVDNTLLRHEIKDFASRPILTLQKPE
jgi:hypothetical protein